MLLHGTVHPHTRRVVAAGELDGGLSAVSDQPEHQRRRCQQTTSPTCRAVHLSPSALAGSILRRTACSTLDSGHFANFPGYTARHAAVPKAHETSISELGYRLLGGLADAAPVTAYRAGPSSALTCMEEPPKEMRELLVTSSQALRGALRITTRIGGSAVHKRGILPNAVVLEDRQLCPHRLLHVQGPLGIGNVIQVEAQAPLEIDFDSGATALKDAPANMAAWGQRQLQLNALA